MQCFHVKSFNLQGLALGLVSSISLGLISLPAEAISLSFVGQSILSGGTQYQQTQVGGLSGITYDQSTNVFYAISDDRGQINNARFYTLNLDLNQFNSGQGIGGVNLTGVTALRQANNTLFQAYSSDTEGIALVGSTVYLSSEGEVSPTRIVNPFVNQFSLATGQQIQALPIPTQFIPQPRSIPTTSGVRNNLSLESLTVTPNQRYLFTASENALVQDGGIATLNNGTSSRILQFDLTTGQPVAQYLYNTEPVALPSNPANGLKGNGLSDLLALDNSGKRFLALERSFSQGATGTPGNTGYTVKLYEVSLENATDISGLSSISGVNGIVGAQKNLLLDLTTLGIPIYNLEGLTFGPNFSNGDRSLIIASDNNFNSSQSTQFLAFRVPSESVPTSIPESSAVFGLIIVGLMGWRTKHL